MQILSASQLKYTPNHKTTMNLIHYFLIAHANKLWWDVIYFHNVIQIIIFIYIFIQFRVLLKSC